MVGGSQSKVWIAATHAHALLNILDSLMHGINRHRYFSAVGCPIGAIFSEVNCVKAFPQFGRIVVLTEMRVIIWCINYDETYSVVFGTSLLSAGLCVDIDGSSGLLYVGLSDGRFAEITTQYNDTPGFSPVTYNPIQHNIANIVQLKIHQNFNSLFVLSSQNRLFWIDIVSRNVIYTFGVNTAQNPNLEIDEASNSLFIGGNTAKIEIIQLDPYSNKKMKYLKDLLHIGSISATVTCIKWISQIKTLFVGLSNGSILISESEIDNEACLKLCKHKSNILCMEYLPTHELISVSSDGLICIWNLKIARLKVSNWAYKNNCMECAIPFFWNLVSMIKSSRMGVRRHHCRICGKSLCDRHFKELHVSPLHGYEYPVLQCNDCMAINVTREVSFCETFYANTFFKSAFVDLFKSRLYTSSNVIPLQFYDLSDTLK